MKRLIAGIVGVGLLWAVPAGAQTTSPAGPAVETFYGGVFGGAAVVDKWSATAGLELGVRVRRNLDIIGEGVWVQNAATADRTASMRPLVEFLEITQGTSATGSVEAPTWMGAAGLRWVFERDGALRPYILATAGRASVEQKATFTVGGTDVTSSIASYGITLGTDLSGSETAWTYGGGAGLLFVGGRWYMDAGIRYTNIQLNEPTNLWRAALGVGFRY